MKIYYANRRCQRPRPPLGGVSTILYYHAGGIDGGDYSLL